MGHLSGSGDRRAVSSAPFAITGEQTMRLGASIIAGLAGLALLIAAACGGSSAAPKKTATSPAKSNVTVNAATPSSTASRTSSATAAISAQAETAIPATSPADAGRDHSACDSTASSADVRASDRDAGSTDRHGRAADPDNSATDRASASTGSSWRRRPQLFTSSRGHHRRRFRDLEWSTFGVPHDVAGDGSSRAHPRRPTATRRNLQPRVATSTSARHITAPAW